jgi:hypothetical protein
LAIYEKKPVSSRAIDNKDTQINSIKIVTGLTLLLEVITFIKSLLSNKLKIISIKAIANSGI